MVHNQGYNVIHVEKQEKVLIITFDNPAKKNSLNRNSYEELTRALREVANDDDITFVVITGKGEFFTAGNDLSPAIQASTNMETYLEESGISFKEMISAFIDCPKLIMALVNGPCIGIGTTIIPLCDIAWCSTTAYFLTPFTKLGIVPEACSSYTLPLILGRSKASEMLLLSEKVTAEEAYHFGLVSKVFDFSTLNTDIWPRIREFSELPPNSVRISKSLLRKHERDAMYRALNSEALELKKRFLTEEFANALMTFAMRKNKSKL